MEREEWLRNNNYKTSKKSSNKSNLTHKLYALMTGHLTTLENCNTIPPPQEVQHSVEELILF